MWSIPGARHFDDCELYFTSIEEDADFLDRENGHYLGRGRAYSYKEQNTNEFTIVTFDNATSIQRRRKLATASNAIHKNWPIKDRPTKGLSRNEASAYFVGCGWSSIMSYEKYVIPLRTVLGYFSILHFVAISPCHYPTDDLVFGSGSKVAVEYVASDTLNQVQRQCTIEDEKLDVSNGRWVRYPYPNLEECGELIPDNNTVAWNDFRPKYDGDRPHCWWRENVTNISTICAELGCKLLYFIPPFF